MKNDVNAIWANCLSGLRKQVAPDAFAKWFVPIKPVKIEGRNIYLSVPGESYKNEIETHYSSIIFPLFRQHFRPDAQLYYVYGDVDAYNAHGMTPRTDKFEPQQYAGMQIVNILDQPRQMAPGYNGSLAAPSSHPRQVDSGLQAEYNFDSFVEGTCNRLAKQNALLLVKNLGNLKFKYNPFIIYGSTGVGKSHLAQAIGIAIREFYPNRQVLFSTTFDFINGYSNAYKNNTIMQFVAYYQSFDVLIVDDVHEFTARKGSQDIFFSLYNQLIARGGQIVITANRVPADLNGIRADLLSRFRSGIAVEIEKPDYSTRLAILQQMCLSCDVPPLENGVLEYIASQVTDDIRQLQYVLNSLVAYAVMDTDSGAQLSLDLAKKVVKDGTTPKDKKGVSVKSILNIVAKYYCMPVEKIVSNCRKRDTVRARQVAMYCARELTKLSAATIGANIGSKNHATVIHSCKVVEDTKEMDPGFARELDEIFGLVNQSF